MRRWTPRAVPLAMTLAAAAGTVCLVPPPAATAAEGNTYGLRYNDGLDSRHAASAVIQAVRDAGYTGRAWNSGRTANDAWNDGLSSSVLGYFGHANELGGAVQVLDTPNDSTDEWIAAGRGTDLVSLYGNARMWSEYLPYVEFDDVRLALMAGCDTAKSSEIVGHFPTMAKERGVDAVVTYPGEVMYPAKCTSCVYSGNYYWDRFAVHAGNNNTVSTALSRAHTDLVAKEGKAGGWGTYRIGGSVASPGSVRLGPAGPGEPLTSQPAGVSPFAVAALTVEDRTAGTSPMGATEEVTSQQGVSYRTLISTGALLDVVAPAATSGEVTLSLAEAQQAARDFSRAHGHPLGNGWVLEQAEATEHVQGEALGAFRWRTRTADGAEGPSQVLIEVDRRTGAVSYAAFVAAVPATDQFTVGEAQALAAAGEVTEMAGAQVDVVRTVWERPTWRVTVDRGTDGQVRDVDVVTVDGRTGEVLAITAT